MALNSEKLANPPALLLTIKRLRRDDKNKSVRMTDFSGDRSEKVSDGSSVTSDEDEIIIDQSQDLLANIRPLTLSRRKQFRVQDEKRTKGRLDDSTNVSRPLLTELRESKNPVSRKESKKSSHSTHEQRDNRDSQSTSHCSVIQQDTGFESCSINFRESNVRELNVRESHVRVSNVRELNVPESHVRVSNVRESNVRKSNVRESRNKRINAETNNPGKLNLILPVLKQFEDANVAARYTSTLLWHGTMEKTAVDTVVKLADAPNSDEATAELCKRKAIKTIKKVYELISGAVRSGSANDTLYQNYLMLILTLCDSWIICEESVKFFMSILVSPESTEDDKEPEEIVEELMQLEQARFALYALIETLKKYVKMRENKSRELNGERIDIDPLTVDQNHWWSGTLSIYAAKNLNGFPLLTKMAMRGVELLSSKNLPTA